ncbi:MAG: GHKL domain-containing protein [Proteocatella sp.]
MIGSNKEISMYLFSNLFLIYVIYRFMGVFFDRETCKRKKEILLFVVYYAVNSLLHVMFAQPFINLFTNIFFLIIISLSYKSSASTKIISVVLIYSLQILSDGIIYNLVGYFTDNLLIMNSGVISNLFLLLIQLIIESVVDFKKESTLNIFHLMAIAVIPTGSIITAFFILLSTMLPMEKTICVSILLVINGLIFNIYDVLIRQYTNAYENELLIQQNISYKNQFEIIRESNENMRILKHDIKNHIYILENMVSRDEKKLAQEYLRDMYDLLEIKKQYARSGNMDIDSILNYKLAEADSLGAKMKLDVKVPENISIRSFDINVILSNLLDNAIEAIKKSENRELEVRIEFVKEILYITIINSCLKKAKEINSNFKTTKTDKKNHGIGLMSVKKTTQKYDGTMIAEQEDEKFSVKILLYSANEG